MDVHMLRGMFRCDYYPSDKLTAFFRSILEKGFGGNIQDTLKLLLNKFGTVAANRWVSREKQAD